MHVIILNSNKALVGNLMVADSIFTRMKGLLGRDSLPDGSGLLLKPCKGVHTFGMRFAIDVVFLSRSNQVVDIIHNLPPNRLTRIMAEAAAVIELPAFSAAAAGLSKGDSIEILA